MTTPRFTGLQTALVYLLLALVPAGAPAQSGMLGGMGGEGLGGRPFRIVVDGGLTIPSGDLKGANDNGFHAGVSIVYKLPGLPIAFRPEFTYTSLQIKTRATALLGQPTIDRNVTHAVTALGHLEVPFGNGLYVFGGVGALNLKSIYERDTTTRTGTSLMVDVGGGYRFEFGPIQAFLEARLGTAAADEKKFLYSRASMIPLSFGFVF